MNYLNNLFFKRKAEDRFEKAVSEPNVTEARKILMENPKLLKNRNSKILTLYLIDMINRIGYQEETQDLLEYAEPLDVALALGNSETVELLLKNGAKLEDPYGDVVKFVFRCHPVNRKDLLVLLLKHGYDTREIRSRRGENLLHRLVRFLTEEQNQDDTIEIAEILINSGISVVATDDSGYSPLEYAVENQNLTMASFFIDKGPGLKHKYERMLFEAVRRNNEELVCLLLSNGADVHAIDQYGQTPLHSACEWTKEKVISLLIQFGADVDLKNKRGLTPFEEINNENPLFMDDRNINGCVRAVMKEYSKLIFGNLPVSESYSKLKQANKAVSEESFNEFTNELNEMKKTKLFGSCSYYSLLRKSVKIKKLSRHLKNEEFIENFERNLKKFPTYEKDLRRIFSQAFPARQELLIVESRLKPIFSNFLPDLVIRSLAENLSTDDLPLE